jgi:hypothetical protein
MHLPRAPFTVAFAHAKEVTGTLPEVLEQFNLVLGSDLAEVPLLEGKVEVLASMAPRRNGLGQETVNAIVGLVAPGADFTWDAAGEHRHARLRLQQLAEQQVKALVGLEDNQRVVVPSDTGTGKIRLPSQWVRHAAQSRKERVLLTCYNDPLGDYFRTEFEDWDLVRAGPFLRLVQELPGAPVL